MAEDFESFLGGAQGKEEVGETDEQFSERYRQAQAQIKQVKKEEGAKKQDDDLLAHLIVKFLGEPANTRFFLLISRLVAKNVTSDLILAIIALIYQPAGQHLHHKFGKINNHTLQVKPEKLSEHHHRKITHWLEDINNISLIEAKNLLSNGLDKEGKIDFILVQLSALVLQEFLEKQEQKKANLEKIQKFCAKFWQNLFSRVADQVKLLGGEK